MQQSSDNQQALCTSGTFQLWSAAYMMTAASESLNQKTVSRKMQQTPEHIMTTRKHYVPLEHFRHHHQHTWWLQPARIWIGRYELKNAADSRTHQSSDNQQTLHISGIFRTWSTAYVMTAASENLTFSPPSIGHPPQRLEVGVKCYRHSWIRRQ